MKIFSSFFKYILNISKIVILYFLGIIFCAFVFSWIFRDIVYRPSAKDVSHYEPKYGNVSEREKSEYSSLGFIIGFFSGFPIVLTSRFFWDKRNKKKNEKQPSMK